MHLLRRKKYSQTFVSVYLYCFSCTGALVVFGGWEYGEVEGERVKTMEYLNGTAWVKQPLKYERWVAAMVLLPCP